MGEILNYGLDLIYYVYMYVFYFDNKANHDNVQCAITEYLTESNKKICGKSKICEFQNVAPCTASGPCI